MPEYQGADQELARASAALRTVSCALVVLVHVNLAIRPGMGTWWPAGFNFTPFFAIPVPAFFMLSGLFAGRYSAGVSRPPLGVFLKKKVRPLLIPFLAWNAILIALHREANHISAGEAMYYLLTGYWQLYYIFVLLQLIVLQYFFEGLTRGRIRWLVAVALLGAAAFGGATDYLLWTRGAAGEFMESQLCRVFLPWGIFYVLGLWLREERPLLAWLEEKRYSLLIITIVSYVPYNLGLRLEDDRIGFNPIQQFLLAGLPFRLLWPVLALVFLRIWVRAGALGRMLGILASVGKDTYGIFLAHTSVLVILWTVMKAAGISLGYGVEVPFIWGVTWLLSCGAVRLIRRARLPLVGPLLLGIRTRRASGSVMAGE